MTRLRQLGAIGVLVFLAGVAMAVLRLPEWRWRRVPDPTLFVTRLQQVTALGGLAVQEAPRLELRSTRWLNDDSNVGMHETAYDMLGSDAAAWLAREGRGSYVEAAARTRWTSTRESGEARVLFSLTGVPVSATWMPDDPLRTLRNPSRAPESRRHALQRMFLPAGAAPAEIQASVLGETVYLAAVPNANPPESLVGTSARGGNIPYVERVAGSPESWRRHVESFTVSSLLVPRLPRMVATVILYAGTFVLFVLLLARRRIDLQKGFILGVVSIALSGVAPLRDFSTWLQMADVMLDVVAKGVALFVLWSAAESWLRSTIPGFRTSLDTLRAGRLGPAAGKALLAGAAIGAGVAGLWLLLLSLATAIPGVAPTDASVPLPMFGAPASPVDEGAIRTAFVLLAIAAASRWQWLSRIRGAATILAALALVTRVPLTSFFVAFAAALILAFVFVHAYTRFGLTALLAAGMTSAILPAALFSVLHVNWLPWSAALLTAFALAPVAFGVIGLRRPAEVEEGRLRVPAFVKRLEEEHRLEYEMDLLARMQLGLLPQEMPRLEGYEIAARSILATEAGGDLYDFVSDSDGRLWIAAGDVSGHGYSCAIAQAMAKAGLASLVESDRTPAVVLERLDRVLRGIGSARTFTSMALLRLDPATGEALFSNAGHPYPWMAGKGTVHEIELPSLPLGQGPERRYVDQPLTIAPGTALVFTSDGLFEGTDVRGRAYGFDRIRDLLGGIVRRPAAAIVDAIVADWRTHVGDEAPADDTTIVVVKRTA